jgi:two-component system NtrC family sensor kinase
MKILIAEDDRVTRYILESSLTEWGHEVVAVADGLAAWERLQDPEMPHLAILDWEMPGMVGPDVCRKARSEIPGSIPYFLLLTARDGKEHVAAAIEAGANDYLTKPFDCNELYIRLQVANSMMEFRRLEVTSRDLERRVQERTAELLHAHADNERLLTAISSILIGIDARGRVVKWNRVAAHSFGLPTEQVLGQDFARLPMPWEDPGVSKQILIEGQLSRQTTIKNIAFQQPSGKRGFVDLFLTPIPHADDAQQSRILVLGENRTEQRLLETHLAQAQKLESIGQLAAGIAHEINTPIQFVGDNIVFLRDSFGAYQRGVGALKALLTHARSGILEEQALEEAEDVLAGADIDYLVEEVPKALEQTLDGIGRVGRIVRAMKDFSHPGNDNKVAATLNRLIENTITVARNEWKYVAEVVTRFDSSLPLVPCLIGEFNQVILNVLVNAAHAIGEATPPDAAERKGTITVSTRRVGPWAEVRIRDTGKGIPEAIQSRIFDPFFTTKPVGKGTGQGLAIAHAVIVKKHGGELTFETELGKGTTFIIRLPLSPPPSAREGPKGAR